ncbi:MAG: hypothetical protein ABIH34_02190 [Nanoarchaeota archaeon]
MDEDLVAQLVSKCKDLTLAQVVESTRVCKMNCNLFGDNHDWDAVFEPLRAAID